MGATFFDEDTNSILENATEIKICQGRTLTFSEFSVEN